MAFTPLNPEIVTWSRPTDTRTPDGKGGYTRGARTSRGSFTCSVAINLTPLPSERKEEETGTVTQVRRWFIFAKPGAPAIQVDDLVTRANGEVYLVERVDDDFPRTLQVMGMVER